MTATMPITPNVEIGPWKATPDARRPEVRATATITVELVSPAGQPVSDSAVRTALLKHLDGDVFEAWADPADDPNATLQIEIIACRNNR
ncbi:hypothetical protein [Nonomuraea sp. LPB2021202275-12-8]|uniref:hypothetical protein n=1 Tax=Nonomuraea sp. LPB2021202275-12-8 TaxID=3120159 RepID=UPI00300D7B5A